jgi:hypothetical protein
MTTFPQAFRELVTPALRTRCRTAGFCIERGRWTFTEGETFVMDLARARGALQLPDRILLELEDWISGQILAASAEMEDADVRRAYVDEVVPV